MSMKTINGKIAVRSLFLLIVLIAGAIAVPKDSEAFFYYTYYAPSPHTSAGTTAYAGTPAYAGITYASYYETSSPSSVPVYNVIYINNYPYSATEPSQTVNAADSGNAYGNDSSKADTQTAKKNDQNLKNLASSAIYGSNGFLPSGLVQWIFVGILILIIVIFTRRILSFRQKYLASPLKHD